MSDRLNYNTLAPAAMKALGGVHVYLHSQADLPKNLIDLAYLRTSQINGCAYCIDMHSHDLIAQGVPVSKLLLVSAWHEAGDIFDMRERGVLAWTETVTDVARTGVPDDAYAAALAIFSEKELADLTVAVGVMGAYNRLAISFHVETPLDLAATLGFYRVELSKRGWAEDGGALVEPDRAVIAFTTTDGPALLRLVHQDDRTIAGLSLHKPAAPNASILPRPGRVRLRLGNATDEETVITINEQTIKLAARAGNELTDDPETGRKSPDSPEIDLPPGKYKVALKIASGAAQNREFEVAADETWGLLAGPAGAPLPVHLY
jgi:AhpD family alkylhydroperoxidase